MASEQEMLAEIKGTTLRVYLYLAKKGEASPREVQRALKMKSPSTAFYHLEKLLRLGVVEKKPGGVYVLSSRVRAFPLDLYLNLLGLQLPRWIPYALFFTIATIVYAVLTYPKVNLLAVLLGGLAALFFWYESWRILRRKII